MKNEQKIIKLAHIGVGGQKGWILDIDGIVGALPATQYKDPTKIIVTYEIKNRNRKI